MWLSWAPIRRVGASEPEPSKPGPSKARFQLIRLSGSGGECRIVYLRTTGKMKNAIVESFVSGSFTVHLPLS
jgi:hypothetical protein